MVIIKNNSHLLEKESSNLIEFYRKNPVIAAQQLLRRDGVPLDLAEVQKIVLTEWWYHKFNILTASRGAGKTFVAAVYAALQLMLYPGIKIGVFAPAFRQSKLIFKEFTRLYNESPLLQQCVDKEPAIQNDQCICIFKSIGRGRQPSELKALPVGSDGGKIRGERFQCFKGDTNLITDKGLVKISDYCENNLNYKILTPYNGFVIPIFTIINLEENLIKITTTEGYNISVTEDQEILTNSKKDKDFQCLVKAKDLKAGDKLLINIGEGIKLDLNYDYIQNIEDGGFEKTYDVSLDTEDHLFIANGIVVHNCVILDEIPHLPEVIFRSSIQPMMSTAINPMQRVRELEKLREEFGDEIGDALPTSDNGYIGITSGYYQFNYWWNEIVNFWGQIQAGSKDYNLRFIPYVELPEAFYDINVVEDAKVNAPKHMFLTEWMAEWIADSQGAFPMSLLESSRDIALRPKYNRDPVVDKGKEYVFGVDVARERDSTAIIVIELGYPSKLVHIQELEEVPFPDQANQLFKLVEQFNPVRIYMDAFGGGGSLRDSLAQPQTVGWPSQKKIITVDADINHTGKRILELFTNQPGDIEDINNNAKMLLEQRAIKLPHANNPIEATRKGNTASNFKEVDLVQELINQMASVVISSTNRGRLHYDLPKSSVSGKSKVKKKDLYSAFLLACKGIYDLQWKPKADLLIIETGVIKELSSSRNQPNINYPGNLTGSNTPAILPDRYVGNYNSPKNSKIIIPGGGVILGRNAKKNR